MIFNSILRVSIQELMMNREHYLNIEKDLVQLMQIKQGGEVSGDQTSQIFSYKLQVAPQISENVFLRLSFSPYIISLTIGLQKNNKKPEKIRKILNDFNSQQMDDYVFCYESNKHTLIAKCNISDKLNHEESPNLLSMKLKSFACSFEKCIEKLYEKKVVCERNQENRKNKINFLRHLILKDIKERKKFYLVQNHKHFESQLFDPELKVLNEDYQKSFMNENMKKIERSLKIYKKKIFQEIPMHPIPVMRALRLGQFQKVKWRSLNKQSPDNKIEKIIARYEILKSSVNQIVGQSLKQDDRIQKTGPLIMKTSQSEDNVSFMVEVQVLKYMRMMYSSAIASFFLELIPNVYHSPSKIFVQFYQNTLSSQNLHSQKDKLKVMEKLAEGIAFFSVKKLAHRDLKPANIMMSKDNIPKIIDFGSSVILDQKIMADLRMKHSLKTTVKYNNRYDELPYAFKNCISVWKYQNNEFFDLYSFGIIFFEYFQLNNLDSWSEDPFIRDNMIWIVQNTALIDPFLRISPQLLLLLIKELHGLYKNC